MLKTIALILATVMLFALVACSNTEPTQIEEVVETMEETTATNIDIAEESPEKSEFVPSPEYRPVDFSNFPVSILASRNGVIEETEIKIFSRYDYAIGYIEEGWERNSSIYTDIFTMTDNPEIRYYISREFSELRSIHQLLRWGKCMQQ